MKLKDCFTFRSVWMFGAILWIMIFHSGLMFNNIVFKCISTTGYGGVDIFLFSSGLGCYYSLERSRSDWGGYFKRRIKRFIPTYFCFIIPYCLYMIFFESMPWQALIGNVFCIQSFTGLGNDYNWYISFIWLFYLLAPFIYLIVNRANTKKMTIIVLLAVIISFPFWGNEELIIGVSRLPIFIIGMIFAKYKDRRIAKKDIILFCLSLITGIILLAVFWVFFGEYLWSHALFWYPFIFIAPSGCILLSIVLAKLQRVDICSKVTVLFAKGGKYTLEIYLFHILIFEIIRRIISISGVNNSNLIWIFGCIVALVTSYAFNRIVKKLQKIFQKRIQKVFYNVTGVELTQYLFNFGNCEFSDIVMNTLGAAIGTVSYLMSSKLRR